MLLCYLHSQLLLYKLSMLNIIFLQFLYITRTVDSGYYSNCPNYDCNSTEIYISYIFSEYIKNRSDYFLIDTHLYFLVALAPKRSFAA